MLRYTLIRLNSRTPVVEYVHLSILRKARQSCFLCKYSTDDQIPAHRYRHNNSKRVHNVNRIKAKLQNRFDISENINGFEDIDDRRRYESDFTEDRFQGQRLTGSKWRKRQIGVRENFREVNEIEDGHENDNLTMDFSSWSKRNKSPQQLCFEEEKTQLESKSPSQSKIHKRKRDTREMTYWKSHLAHTDSSRLLPEIIGSGREVLFGVHPVITALTQNKRNIHKLYIKKSLAHNDKKVQNIIPLCERMGIAIDHVNSNFLRDMSGSRPNQGVCLEVDPLEIPMFDMENFSGPDVDNPELWLAPIQIKDPMNMGSLLRTAYFLGVNRVLLSDNHCCKPNPIVCKASSGAMEIVNMSMMKNITKFLELCKLWKQRGGKVIGTSQSTQRKSVTEAHQYTANEPTLLIAGNEMQGIPEGVQGVCDSFISIYPDANVMPEIDSLNVSVAMGIIIHSLRVNSKGMNWAKPGQDKDLEVVSRTN